MIFGLVRMKGNAARPKIVSIIITTLISGLLVSIPVPANAAACNPTSTTVSGETVLTFSATGNCDWTVPAGVISARVLVVGGGSSGGSGVGGSAWPQGGGGGEVKDQTVSSLATGSIITITVGNGGAAIPIQGTAGTSVNNGGASSFNLLSASGGITPINTTNKGGTSGNGNQGGTSASPASGGGGGAGGIGVGLNGGPGVVSNISGNDVMYGSGGAGNNSSSGTATSGGGTAGNLPAANRGGGGSSSTAGSGSASAGGSGVVIVRYLAIPAGKSALIFNPNGASGSKSTVLIDSGVSSVLPNATGFTNEGFEFNGWNTLANGSGTAYALGASITTSSNTTLYAQWTRIPVPSCAAGVGEGGPGTSSTIAVTKAGNGCVGISYKVGNVTTVATFNYTGSDQSWTVPANVTSATFYLIGAGGGGGRVSFGGGGGGYATGSYAVTAGQVLKVIVGEGGGGVAEASVAGYTGKYTNLTYGGGGRGGAVSSASALWYSSGGGRSAIRLPGASTDLVTAAGGGGGSYGQCGYGGGGLEGAGRGTATTGGGRGGTQSAGGAGGTTANAASIGQPGTAGVAYLGGDGKDESGGGGGGFYGGGGGGDNSGGGGGSSYVALLTGGSTTAGADCGNAAASTGLVYVVSYDANGATTGSVPSNGSVSLSGGTLTLASNTGTLAKTNYSFNGWNTAANGSGTNYAVGATTFTPSGDTTLYAQWDSTITYDGNGQTSLVATVPAATTAKGSSNTTLAATTTLLRTNFIFDGWNTAADGSGTPYASGLTTYSSTGSRTLYAQWKAVITFSGNTSTSGTAPAIVNATTSTISLPSNAGNLVKTGYQFSGWNTAANGSGINYAAGDSYPITGQATLYANWTPSNTGLTPSFNTNTSSPIGVVASTGYVINTVYTNNANDLVLSQYADKIQIIATVPAGTLAITTTTNLTLPTGYQAALNTADATISFIGNLADVNAALASLRYVSPSTAVSTTISVYAAYAGINGDYRYNPTTGSSYWRGASAVVWADANNPTTASSNCGVSFNGMCGYMTVPNDAAETQWVASKLGTGWIGITDATQGAFKYLPNAPNGNGSASFTYFASGEGTIAAEQYVAIYYANGYWVDLSTQSMNALYEFGGKSETPIFASLTRTIAIGGLVATGTPTLATASDTGSSNSDKITSVNTPTINIGGLTVGATITLTATPSSGTAVTCTFVATTTTGSCTFPTMGDGTYSIVATQTLGGTTTAASAALANVVIDATRPTVTLTSSQIVSGGNRTATQAAPGITNQIIVTFSEAVSGFLISEVTKAASSTGWAITTDALTNAVIAQFTFNVANTTGAGGTPGTLILSILEGVASDVAGNTNTATASNFVINTLIQLTLTNEYDPCCVIGGNNELIAQTTPGGAITLPGQGTLLRTGYTFAGWSLVNTGGNGTVLGATYTPTVPVKLYSSWIPQVYVVTYNANGGNGAPTAASQNYTFGSANLALTTKGTLARTGYTFGGWNTLATGLGTNYLESASYKPTASIILYAKWTANTYAVTFDVNGGAGTQMTNLSITAGTATPLTANTYTRTGYTFGGWNTLANGTGTAYANSASVTLFGNTTIYAQWVPVKPGVPTVAISGSAGNTQITVAVTAATLSTTSGPASTFTVTSSPGAFTCTITSPATTCTFTGLTNGQAYTFTAVGINTTGSSASSTASASATPAPYLVTYSLNSGTLTPGTANYNLGTPLTLPLPTRSGYTFGGWFGEVGLTTLVGNDGASYSPTVATTLYAKWTGVVYTITYNGNGSSGGTVPASGSYTNGGTAYPVVDNTGSLAKTGYTFAGWYTTATGNSGTAYAAAAPYSSAANTTLFAKWSPVARTVTYALNSGAGTIPTQLTGKYIGDTFSTAVTTGFSRSGYSFTGWSDGTSIYAANSTYTVGGTDVVLTAQWAAVSYSVTFLSNGATSGAAPTQANLTAGQTFTTPANPFTKDGFNFTGWNDGASNYLANVTYTMTAANTVLVAQWTARGYAITYNGNTSDGGSTPTAGNYVTGSPAYSVALNTFTKTGYIFTGWKTAADGTGTAYAAGSGYSSTADLVLYAQWSAKSIAITYNRNGAAGATPASATWTYNSTPQVTLPLIGDLTKAGYTFGGWATSASATTGATTATPTDDTTYFAVWTLTDLAITYTAGAGTGSVTGTTAKMGTTFTLAAKTGLVAPAPSGGCVTYTFATWAYNGATYNEGSSFVMGSTAIPFEAQWTCVFNVRYTLNGGTGAIADVQKANNDSIVIGAAPTRDGYTFANWVDQSGASWAPGASTTVIETRYLFFAVWTATPRTVTYALNGGSGTEPTALTGKTIGQIFSTATTSSTKAGYTFGGWNDGTTNYPAGSSYTINLANVTLTAVWSPATFSITYNGNGATGGATPSNGTFTTGGSYSIPANSVGNLAKAGFSFAGWSTAANGGGTSYADAATTLTTTSDVILYAKWSAASYAVTYVLNGATSALPTQSAVQYGSTFTLAAAATQTGKNFIGWSDGTNTYGGGSTYTMGTAAVTLTASWQDQVYAITYALNGGSGTAPVQSGLANGGTFTVATTSSTKAGYTFAGWNNGTANVSAGATYTMTANNVTLTAVWTIAAPAAPSSVSAAGGDGIATITVAPSGSGGAPTSYVVTASPGGATCTVSAPATTCSISPLTNGTSYTFSATATNSTGTSAAATSAAVTPAGKPDAPTGVNALSGNGSATVSFVAPTVTGGPAIASYTVTASPNGATCTVNAPATSCVVPGLTNGTAYTFAVTANNGLFTSSASTASSSVVPSTVPDAPTSVTAASTTSGSATITFTAPVNNGGSAVTGYTVTSSPAGATCTGSGTTYTCTGLTDGTAYTYSVVAVNAKGNSTSATSSALTTQGAAAAPTTISAATGDGEATVTFSGAVANGSTITGYTVKAYDSTGNEVSGATCTVTTAATNASCVVTGLTNGSSYTFKAITNSTANSASVTSTLSIATTAITPAKAPDAPSGVQVTAGTGKVTVSWTAPSSNGSPITSYTVTSSPGGFTCTVSAPATTCDVSTGLVAGTNYTFQVTATSVAGTSGASTASASVAINAAPSVPLNVVATSGNASASVSWDPPANTNGSAITGYTVTAYTAGNIASGTCPSTAPATTCVVNGLTNGVPYTFKVTATNGIGTSAASTASSAATPSTVPNAPTNVVAAMGDASATVSFITPANNGGSDVLSYTVTSSPGSFTCTVNAPATSCNVTGLSNGTAHTFTVKATNKNGDSAASTASTAGTPVLSSAPILVNPGQPTGNPYVGSPLTSNVTFSGSPTPTVTYQWKVCTDPVDVSTCTDISGATSATYTPTLSDLGKYIVVDATATNRVGVLTETSDPTLVIKPEIAFAAPSPVPGATAGTAYVLSMAAAGGVGTFAYTVRNGALPAGVSLDPATGQISGTPTTAGTYTFTVRVTDSNGVYKDVVVTIVVAAAAVTQPVTTPTAPAEPQPRVPTCDADCQAAKEVAATKAAADKAAADAIAKAAAEKAAADAAVATKVASDTAATNASTKATADAAAAAAAAKAAVDKAAAAAVAQAAADAAAKAAAAQAKAAADAQAAATKAAADAAAALKNSTTTAAAKAAATASANKAAADATAAVKAAATAAQQAAQAKTTAANATKQVDIAINSLNSKTAASQASAQANAVAAAAKAAANEAAAAAATKATVAKAAATTAQKAASDTAARIATEQKQAADAAALAKIAADAAVKATAEKVAAVAAATKASQDLATVLAQKATLAEQAAKATDQTARAEIQKKIDEVSTKVEEVQKSVEAATTKADAAVAVQETAVQTAETATKEATTQAAEAVAVKAESVTKTAEATKAVAVATVAAKVATAAKEAAAKVPATATIIPKASTSTNKNSATATVTGLKPGQKVKVTVNVKGK